MGSAPSHEHRGAGTRYSPEMTGWRRRGLLLPLYLSFLLLSLSPGCAPPGAPVAVSPGTAGAGKGTGEPPVLVYVGMAGGDLDVFHLDAESGHLSRRGSVSMGRSPSSLVRSADREVLIATDEATGTATAMAINSRTGGLRTVGRAATGGLQPTGATLDRTGHYLLVANRGSGNVSVLAIKTGGALEAIETFPAGLGADAVAVHPANDLAFVANLRAATISQYKFNTGTGMLTPKPGPPLKLPPGSGPTRLVCHPSGRWVYILNETNDTIAAHVVGDDIRALSSLASQIVSTLPSGFPAAKSRPGDLLLGPKGRFLYATNRGHDSVVTFAVDGSGDLTLVGHQPSGGRGPAALAVEPSGRYLFVANHEGRNLVVFRLDPTTGSPALVQTVPLRAVPLAVYADAG